jgi:pimeloyl-ACP methyl ester carboxylesterase
MASRSSLSWYAALALGVLASPLLVLAALSASLRSRPRRPAAAGDAADAAGADAPPPAVYLAARWGERAHREVRPGVILHTVSRGPRTAPILLCLHGFPECWFAWRHWLLALSRGRRVVAVDLRGFGESCERQRRGATWAGSRVFGADEVVEDLLALVGVLRAERRAALGAAGAESGDGGVEIAAHDWGGIIAHLLAPRLEARGELAALVVLAAPHPSTFARNVTLAQSVRSIYLLQFQVPSLPEWYLSRNGAAAVAAAFLSRSMGVVRRRSAADPLALSSDDVAVFTWAARRPGALTAMLAYYRQLFAPSFAAAVASGRAAAARVQAKTMMLWGSRDGALGPELARGHERRYANLRVRVIANCSHWVQQDHVREVLVEVAAFLGADLDEAALLGEADGAAAM